MGWKGTLDHIQHYRMRRTWLIASHAIINGAMVQCMMLSKLKIRCDKDCLLFAQGHKL